MTEKSKINEYCQKNKFPSPKYEFEEKGEPHIKVKRLKSKDILDRSNVDDGTLMDDSRIKAHNFYCKDYPYTVEYNVEIKINNTFFS